MATDGARSSSSDSARDKSALAYDVGYVIPFLAGQLRALWAEHGADTAESRHHVGPVLSAIMSGGVLQLLLMAVACADASVRATGYESLSILLALAGHWKTDLLRDEAKDGKQQGRRRNPFRELPNFVWLLRSVRNSTECPEAEGGVPPALPSLLASFLCACVPILLEPDHFLYVKVGKFIMAGVKLDLSDFPLFYKLLLSEDMDGSQEARPWMIRVMRRALHWQPASEASVIDADAVAGSVDRGTRAALEKRHVVPWVLSFASSNELGGFSVWNEAVECLEAVLAPRGTEGGGSGGGARGEERFGIAEWILSQVAR